MFCTNCGKEINENAIICIHCGCSLKKNNTEGEKTFMSALLLCLFLGPLGAHRFYTGHTGTAILQLILSIIIIGLPITSIWTLIDLISILSGSFRDANGQELAKN